jgi:hypothetical protein
VAYSLNVTAVPSTGYLGWITVWPTGQAEPVVSTLNAWSGLVTANAAVVPAGTGGAISIYASDPTDVFIDINGYFGYHSTFSPYSQICFGRISVRQIFSQWLMVSSARITVLLILLAVAVCALLNLGNFGTIDTARRWRGRFAGASQP